MADLPPPFASAMIEPLVAPEVDLRDFKFMPLDVTRLRRSKQWLIARRRPEIGFYALNLWAASWHEVPAASIEDDDDVLADAAMCDPRKWKKVKEDVLRGWVKCSDGRFYHPVVAEKAREAWAAKMSQRSRTESARQAKQQRRSLPSTDAVTTSVTEIVTDSKGQGQGQGQGQEESSLRSDRNHAPEKSKPREPSNLEILTECLSDQTARDLIAHRKAKRSPMTPRAARLLVDAFLAYGSPEKAAQEMISRGWTGFKPEWMSNAARAGPTRANGRGSMLDAAIEYINENGGLNDDGTIDIGDAGSAVIPFPS